MIPKKGECDCEACKAYWKAVELGKVDMETWEAWEAYQEAAREAHKEADE